jgi:hypothetical protein
VIPWLVRLGRAALVRLGAVIVGGIAVTWGVAVLPTSWPQSGIDRTAAGVLEGNSFKRDELNKLLPRVGKIESAEYCRPSGLRSAAVIRVRLLEDAIAAAERQSTDDNMSVLDDSIRRSLGCSSADPFLWLVLFWLENNQNGYGPTHLEYLRKSYQLGPSEGWIGLKRNGIAIALFDQLPPDLAEAAKREFVALVNSGLYSEMAAVLTGSGWRIRDQLLPRLKDIEERHREIFAGVLYRLGYDVEMPGVARPDPRPWH